MDFSGDMLIYVIGGLAFLAIAGLGLALTGDESKEKAVKRAKQVASGEKGNTKGRGKEDVAASRRKQTQQMLKKLREQDAERRKSLKVDGMDAKLRQAGLELSSQNFYIICVVMAIVFAALTYVSGAAGPPKILGFKLTEVVGEQTARMITVSAAALAGGMGLPHWIVGFLAKGRNKKMMGQFADAIDIIVRGVKSGLPLTECLRIIAKESPAPLGPEFAQLTDNLQMGMTTERALQNFYKRVPLPEVNFFVIVLSIQAKAGGNLSEALGNLSAVIRSRKMMREKIKALSSEAKASAYIIGALPFVVAFMVYMTSPGYIIELFIKPAGHAVLFVAFCLMATGITVMRKMISFDI
ncbi:MAG: type II secretion system F family protein [Pseudomonadota bacterium]